MKAYDAEWWGDRYSAGAWDDPDMGTMLDEMPATFIVELRSRLAHEIRERRRWERAHERDMAFWKKRLRQQMEDESAAEFMKAIR